uniref:Inhibitor of growth family member 5 n=1 Tax=Sus scrofa TaxID=9823 RepID=A0A8D1WE50_PIG
MATAMYLEHYLDSIENLPCELQRNFQLMRELDQRTEDKKAEIDILAAEYIATVKTLSPDQRVEHLQKIQSAYSKCKEYSDDKVQLAMQTYEMVDKHIRRLDADLARFEADLKDKMEGSDFESSGGRGLKKGRGQKEKRGSRGRGRRTSEEDTPKKKKHKGGSEFSDTVLSVHPSDVLDMPVDPNEPTYCLCHQVSYGEMIGCDNPDVLPTVRPGEEEEEVRARPTPGLGPAPTFLQFLLQYFIFILKLPCSERSLITQWPVVILDVS